MGVVLSPETLINTGFKDFNFLNLVLHVIDIIEFVKCELHRLLHTKVTIGFHKLPNLRQKTLNKTIIKYCLIFFKTLISIN